MATRGVTHHASADAFLAAVEPLLARNAAVRVFVTAWVATWRDDPRSRPLVAATCAIDGAHGFALLREGPLVIDNSDPQAAARARGRSRVASRAGRARDRRGACVRGIRRGVAGARAVRRVRRHAHAPSHADQLADVPPAPGPAARGARGRPAVARAPRAGVRARGTAARPSGGRPRVGAAARAPARRAALGRWRRARRIRVGRDRRRSRCADRARVHAAAATGAMATRRRWWARWFASASAAGVQRVFLVTDLDNPTSNGVYARLGFRPVSDQVRIDLGPAADVRA